MKKAFVVFYILISVNLFAQQTGADDHNRFLLAQSYEQQQNYEQAQKIYEVLYQKQPGNLQYFNALQRVYIQQKNYAASISLIEKRLIDFPDDVNLYGLLGSAYYLQGNSEKAYQVWDEPLNKASANQSTFRVIANYAIERRAFDKAIEVLEKGKPTTKDPFIFSMDLANLYSLTMQYDKAAAEYISVLEIAPSQLSVVQSRVLSYITKPDAIESTINVVERKADSGNLAVLSLLARLYTEKRNFDKALKIYTQIDTRQQANGGELYNFAEFVFREGEYNIASEVYESIIRKYPESKIVSAAKLGHAKSLEASILDSFYSSAEIWKTFSLPPDIDPGTIEPVIKAFNEIVDIYEHSEVAVESLLRISQLKFRLLKDHEGAKVNLQTIIDNYPGSRFAADAHLDLAEIYLIEDSLPESEKLYDKVLSLRQAGSEKKSEAHFHLAKLKAFKGQFDDARTHLAEITKNLKDDLANNALELSLLMNTAKDDSSNLSLFSEAELLAEQMQFAEAKDKYNIIAEDKKAFVFHSIVKLRSAQMEIALNNYQSAIDMLYVISEEKENNIYADKALYLLGNIYEFALDSDTKAIESYEQLLMQFPGSIYLESARERIMFIKNKSKTS